MAKSNGNGLAKSNAPGALAVPEHLAGGAMIEGINDGAADSTNLGRLTIYHGTPDEQAKYAGCDFKPGAMIDVLEKREVASKRIIPVGGYVSYVNWPKNAMRPLYVVKNRAQVPPEDLEWLPDPENPGANTRAASRCVNMIVLVVGEPFPFLFTFKRTSEAVGDAIAKLEERNGMAKRGRGCYEIGTEQATSKAGKKYNKLTYRPVGGAPEEMLPLLNDVVSVLSAVKARAEQVEQEVVDEAGGDNVPI